MRLSLIPVDLLVALNFSLVMFSVPVFLRFFALTSDCAKHGTRSGCLDAYDGNCVWQTQVGKCVFADFERVNCRDFDSSPEACAHNDACVYWFPKSRCDHRAGFNDLESGLFAGATTLGGVFGPLLLRQIASASSYSVSVCVCGVSTLLASVLFTAGVATGDFGLIVSSRIFASVSSYSSYLFADLLRAAGVANKKQMISHVWLMGTSVAVMALLVAVYLFCDTPSRELDVFNFDPRFRLKLQLYNIVSYIVAVGLFAFAVLLRIEYFADDVEGDGDAKDDEQKVDEQKDEVSGVDAAKDGIVTTTKTEPTAEAVAAPEDDEDGDGDGDAVAHLGDDDDDDTKGETTEASPWSLTNPDATAAPEAAAVDHDGSDEDAAAAAAAQADDVCDKYLMWSGGLLAPVLLQVSGLSAVLSFTPEIMRDTVSDDLLSQLIFAAGMPPGALLSLVALKLKVFTPLQVFVISGAGCCLSSLTLGLALLPPAETGATGISRGAQPGLAAFGLVFFAVSFMFGMGTHVFSALVEVYTRPGSLGPGLAVSGSWTAVLTSILRFVFPLFVAAAYPADARVGRAVAFFGFAGFGFAALCALVITQRLRRGTGAKLFPFLCVGDVDAE